jgi:hypothetical protein
MLFSSRLHIMHAPCARTSTTPRTATGRPNIETHTRRCSAGMTRRQNIVKHDVHLYNDWLSGLAKMRVPTYNEPRTSQDVRGCLQCRASCKCRRLVCGFHGSSGLHVGSDARGQLLPQLWPEVGIGEVACRTTSVKSNDQLCDDIFASSLAVHRRQLLAAPCSCCSPEITLQPLAVGESHPRHSTGIIA